MAAAGEPRYLLIGTEQSYFAGKVRAYLRYKDVDWEEALCTRQVYREVIRKRTGVYFVPVLLDTATGNAIQDSAAIIDYIEERHPEPTIHPPARERPRQHLVSHLIELFADQWLFVPALHYRWNFPEQSGFLRYEWGASNSPELPRAEREERIARPGGKGASMSAMLRSLPSLGITPETIPAIEASYQRVLEALDRHFSEHLYLLGGRPCLGDFALLGPLYAHLFRDPVPGFLMKTRAPAVAEWVERTNGWLPARVRRHAIIRAHDGAWLIRSPEPTDPDREAWFAGDAVPPSLLALLAQWFEEFAPVLESTVVRLREYLERLSSADDEVPRTLGEHSFRLGGVDGRRAVFSFDVWRLQRVLDRFAALTGDGQPPDAVAELIDAMPGGPQLLGIDLSDCRLRRAGNRLYPALASRSR